MPAVFVEKPIAIALGAAPWVRELPAALGPRSPRVAELMPDLLRFDLRTEGAILHVTPLTDGAARLLRESPETRSFFDAWSGWLALEHPTAKLGGVSLARTELESKANHLLTLAAGGMLADRPINLSPGARNALVDAIGYQPPLARYHWTSGGRIDLGHLATHGLLPKVAPTSAEVQAFEEAGHDVRMLSVNALEHETIHADNAVIEELHPTLNWIEEGRTQVRASEPGRLPRLDRALGGRGDRGLVGLLPYDAEIRRLNSHLRLARIEPDPAGTVLLREYSGSNLAPVAERDLARIMDAQGIPARHESSARRVFTQDDHGQWDTHEADLLRQVREHPDVEPTIASRFSFSTMPLPVELRQTLVGIEQRLGSTVPRGELFRD